MDDKQNKIKIEVAYAIPEEQLIVPMTVDEGTTVQQAIELSGLLEKYPDIEIGKKNKIGIFGKLNKATTVLRDKDRVEIYRPLIADPKEVRRKRAAEGKRMKKGGGDLENAEQSQDKTA
jgi:putative ubiquitin-RnfH superfamily antitoxin RatB of RatAB toxin-antitoxin module